MGSIHVTTYIAAPWILWVMPNTTKDRIFQNVAMAETGS